MKRQHKILFRNAGKSIRKQLHELAKHPKPFHVMSATIPRPIVLKRCDGSRVIYDGP